MKTHMTAFNEGSCDCVTPGDEWVHRQEEGICDRLRWTHILVRRLDTIPPLSFESAAIGGTSLHT